MNTMFYVSLPYACAGVEVKDGVVTRAAPIFRWMIGKRWNSMRRWAERKGAEIVELSGDAWQRAEDALRELP